MEKKTFTQNSQNPYGERERVQTLKAIHTNVVTKVDFDGFLDANTQRDGFAAKRCNGQGDIARDVFFAMKSAGTTTKFVKLQIRIRFKLFKTMLPTTYEAHYQQQCFDNSCFSDFKSEKSTQCSKHPSTPPTH